MMQIFLTGAGKAIPVNVRPNTTFKQLAAFVNSKFDARHDMVRYSSLSGKATPLCGCISCKLPKGTVNKILQPIKTILDDTVQNFSSRGTNGFIMPGEKCV